MNIEELKNRPSRIVVTGKEDTDALKLTREYCGTCIRFQIENTGKKAIPIKEICLLEGKVTLLPETRFYAEGYNKLSQYGGTIGNPESIGNYTDKDHYRLPTTDQMFTAYNMLLIYEGDGICDLIGFASCRRFSNEIRFAPGNMAVVVDTENKILSPGEIWELEDVCVIGGEDKNRALAAFAGEIQKRHRIPIWDKKIAGWCSWYAYGPNVTEEDIRNTMDMAKTYKLPIEYIQIDDGYEPYIGDWMEASAKFPKGMRELCGEIKKKGFEPAIWIAPFIAEEGSKLFQEHRDWFVKDEAGNPLPSDRDSFGGWRNAPWYMLDTTHPEVLQWLKEVFHTMHTEWGCKYFKMDALMWGALPFGKRKDPNVTRVEAYRRGLAAIQEGAGADSYLLGANAPMWPSIGLLHGMRVGNDITRTWDRIKRTGEEIISRDWQDRNLWRNDPDCIVLANRHNQEVGAGGEKANGRYSAVTEEEFAFHRAMMLAHSFIAVSGDRLENLSEQDRITLGKIMTMKESSVLFEDKNTGRMGGETSEILFLFNWEEDEQKREIPAGDWPRAEDFWTGSNEKINDRRQMEIRLCAHSACVVRLGWY